MKQVVLVFFVMVALSLTASGTYFTEENVYSFIEKLEEHGFIVQQGMFGGFDLLDLFANYMVPDCSGNNADNPYLVYYLPTAPSQEFENSLPFTFRLQEDEALVFLGWTPPEVAYFGYVTLIMFRYLPGQSTPVRIFASVGDTINITNIKAGESIYENTAGTIFNAPTVILSTPDRNIDKTIRAIAEEVGFSRDIINTNPIPSALLKLGIEPDSDELIFGARFALFKNPEDKAYALDPPVAVDGKIVVGPPYSGNFRGWVLRVTPSAPVELDPFPVPSMTPRDTGDYSELDLKPTMDRLEQAILNEYSHLHADVLRTRRWVEASYIAIQNVTDVLGDSRDSTYFRSDSFVLEDDPDDFAIVFGPVRSLTGKSIYSSFTVYTEDPVKDLLPEEVSVLFGFSSVHSGYDAESKLGLVGSAERFLPDDPNAKYFFVWKVAKSNPNNEDYCLVIPEKPASDRMTPYRKLMIAFRSYVNPATGVGPSFEEVLIEKVIHFTPKK